MNIKKFDSCHHTRMEKHVHLSCWVCITEVFPSFTSRTFPWGYAAGKWKRQQQAHYVNPAVVDRFAFSSGDSSFNLYMLCK